jgi:hypothetical protein
MQNQYNELTRAALELADQCKEEAGNHGKPACSLPEKCFTVSAPSFPDNHKDSSEMERVKGWLEATAWRSRWMYRICGLVRI